MTRRTSDRLELFDKFSVFIHDLKDEPELREGLPALIATILKVTEAIYEPRDEAAARQLRLDVAIIQLHLITMLLGKLPELTAPLHLITALNRELANAMCGAEGPLTIKGRTKRGRRPMAVQSHIRMCITAAAVEQMRQFVPDQKTKAAVKEVAKLFREVGVLGDRGAPISESTITGWHERVLCSRTGPRYVKSVLAERKADTKERAVHRIIVDAGLVRSISANAYLSVE